MALQIPTVNIEQGSVGVQYDLVGVLTKQCTSCTSVHPGVAPLPGCCYSADRRSLAGPPCQSGVTNNGQPN